MSMPETSVLSRDFPNLRYLAAPLRWFFGNRRRVLTAAATLLALLATPLSWWSIQLAGLPGIGDPFDVAAFRATTIPDDRNAYILYRRAAERLRPLEVSAKAGAGGPAVDIFAHWSAADLLLRKCAEDNREALELFRQGSERPDAYDPDPKLLWSIRDCLTRHLVELTDVAPTGPGRRGATPASPAVRGWRRSSSRPTRRSVRSGSARVSHAAAGPDPTSVMLPPGADPGGRAGPCRLERDRHRPGPTALPSGPKGPSSRLSASSKAASETHAKPKTTGQI